MTMLKRLFSISLIAFSLGACSTYDPATRNAPLEVPSFQAAQPSFDVTELRVAVPKSLSVSEANMYYPVADIVWRGDPIGNRHKQILDIFAGSAQEAQAKLEGVQPVIVNIEVARFHSLTEKARYTVGGVHSIKFDMTVRSAETGDVIVPTRRINADLAALGGRAAIEAERNGVTQKSRISSHLAYIIEQELSRPLVAEGSV
ncbi:MAG: DUF6778 family protein [Pseudomonadota bacterium]